MILADTSVIIEFWRNPTESYRRVFLDNEVSVCGVTRAELLHGARNAAELQQIEEAIAGLRSQPIDEQVWADLGRNLHTLRLAGLVVPFQDALLATVAIQHGMAIWSLDEHFVLIARVLPALKLYSVA